MIDLRKPVPLDGTSDVVVYPDDTVPTSFYAVPSTPRVAVDETGAPQVSLMVYGRAGAAGFQARGGILSLATDLQLTAEQAEQVRAALAKRLAAEPRPEDTEPPKPTLLAVTWLSGSVDVTLAPDVHLRGVPSLFGGNRCAFSANFTAAQVQPILDAWKQGMPNASIEYTMTLQTAGAAAQAAEWSAERSWTGSGETGTIFFSATARHTAAPEQSEMQFKGPLFAQGTDPGRFLTLTGM